MIRTWVGYDEEKAIIVDVMEYEGADFDHIPGATYVEIFPPLYSGAIKLEKDATGNISIVRDDDKYEILHVRSLNHVRLKRTTLLTESDFIFTADVLEQMTDENKTEWREYRKKLRDFPTAITTNIITPVWPEKPTLAFE
jgi:hypothetical protein